jgi:hypothetical protein
MNLIGAPALPVAVLTGVIVCAMPLKTYRVLPSGHPGAG